MPYPMQPNLVAPSAAKIISLPCHKQSPMASLPRRVQKELGSSVKIRKARRLNQFMSNLALSYHSLNWRIPPNNHAHGVMPRRGSQSPPRRSRLDLRYLTLSTILSAPTKQA